LPGFSLSEKPGLVLFLKPLDSFGNTAEIANSNLKSKNPRKSRDFSL